MHLWTEIRRLALTKQKSKRAICQEYDLHWKTLQKILNHEEPPGYRQRRPRAKPKLDRFLPIIHEILEQDKTSPPKQRHTIKRIFERLRAEHGYEGGLSVVGDAVRAWRAPGSVAPLLTAIERLAEDAGVLGSSGALLTRAAELAERHSISVYDAAYAASAEEMGLRLVSCDERDLVSQGLATLPANARAE